MNYVRGGVVVVAFDFKQARAKSQSKQRSKSNVKGQLTANSELLAFRYLDLP
jgi:hypothetical protein